MKKVKIISCDQQTLMDMKVDDHQIEVLKILQTAGILEFEIVKNEQIEKLLKSTEKNFSAYSGIELMIKKMNEAEAVREATDRDILICILQMLEKAGFTKLIEGECGILDIDEAIKDIRENKNEVKVYNIGTFNPYPISDNLINTEELLKPSSFALNPSDLVRCNAMCRNGKDVVHFDKYLKKGLNKK